MRKQNYTAELKAKVALEAIRGMKTISEISVQYGVHPNVVSLWKKQALTSFPELFRSGKRLGDDNDNSLKERLYQQIGQLQVELEWLKKKTGYSS
jgi:putative transposase